MVLGFAKPKWPQSATLELADGDVDVAVRVHPRARSYRLSIARNGDPILTVPPYGRWGEAEQFLQKQRHWLDARLKRRPKAPQFADGETIPLRGMDHLIVATGGLRGSVTLKDGERPEIHVPGDQIHIPRRLTDWLKKQAHADLEPSVAHHAANLGVKPTSIRVRGQSSRWGSCSSAGRLNFNWRLVLAPPFVLDYVAAHEVAHLVEMNHSDAFWAQVEKTLPDMNRGRAWLRAHGSELMAMGRD